jgi:ribosomal protein S18 acetylase RimI-like enzyme
MLAASRSQLDRGIWEYLYGYDEATALAFLRQVAVTDEVHLFHHSLFLVAEVDGESAAAMCGYDRPTQGFPVLGVAMPAVFAVVPPTIDDAEMARRSDILLGGFPPDPVENPWTVENVATKPGFRRLGLVDELLRAQLDRGRERGYDHAQISVFPERAGATRLRERRVRSGRRAALGRLGRRDRLPRRRGHGPTSSLTSRTRSISWARVSRSRSTGSPTRNVVTPQSR